MGKSEESRPPLKLKNNGGDRPGCPYCFCASADHSFITDSKNWPNIIVHWFLKSDQLYPDFLLVEKILKVENQPMRNKDPANHSLGISEQIWCSCFQS